jgi:quinol monooxygenase YgiN
MLTTMIIVTGSVQVKPDALDAALGLSLAHVRRSRAEPGCLLHSVHQDVEDPHRVVFLEHWADKAALAAHFQVAASLEFVNAVGALAASPPTIEIYEAALTRV